MLTDSLFRGGRAGRMRGEEATDLPDVLLPLDVTAYADELVPGVTCTLTITKQVETECVELPLSALVPSIRGLWSCHHLVPLNNAAAEYEVKRCDVSVVHTNGQRVYVATTLPDGAMVVRHGNHKLVPGTRVRIAADAS